MPITPTQWDNLNKLAILCGIGGGLLVIGTWATKGFRYMRAQRAAWLAREKARHDRAVRNVVESRIALAKNQDYVTELRHNSIFYLLQSVLFAVLAVGSSLVNSRLALPCFLLVLAGFLIGFFLDWRATQVSRAIGDAYGQLREQEIAEEKERVKALDLQAKSLQGLVVKTLADMTPEEIVKLANGMFTQAKPPDK